MAREGTLEDSPSLSLVEADILKEGSLEDAPSFSLVETDVLKEGSLEDAPSFSPIEADMLREGVFSVLLACKFFPNEAGRVSLGTLTLSIPLGSTDVFLVPGIDILEPVPFLRTT